MSDKIKVIELDMDRSFDDQKAEKNDDGSIETDTGLHAISPAAVFPTGGNTYVPSLHDLCNMDSPPPVLNAKDMAVLLFRGAYLPIEHGSVYTDNLDVKERARLTAIAQTRIARQEVGQRQVEMTSQQRQFSDAFLLSWKVLGAVFVVAAITIVFIIYGQG